jgi:hypothetical protein
MAGGGDGLAQSDSPNDPAVVPQSAADPRSESLPCSAADAESASSWQSDWESDDDPADPTDWESTGTKPGSAYPSYEDGNSYQYSEETPLEGSNENSYRYSDEDSYDLEGGRYNAGTVSSPEYGEDALAGYDDYDPDVGDDRESADGDYDSWESDDDEQVEQVAMRESWDGAASQPGAGASQSGFDPVAPQYRSDSPGTSYDAYSEDASDSGRAEAWGAEASSPEDAPVRPAGDVVQVPAAARYASHPYGTDADVPGHSGAYSAGGVLPGETGEAGPQTTLVPVEPAAVDDGGESPCPAIPGPTPLEACCRARRARRARRRPWCRWSLRR